MSRKKDKRKPISLLCEEIIAAHKKGLNDTKFISPSCKNTNTKAKSMALSWKPEYLNWPAVGKEGLFQLDRLNERAAAIFTDPDAGTTSPAHNWIIRSMGRGEPGHGDSLGKELLIKLSEGLKGEETMNLYQVYIVDLKDHSIEKYGPIIAKNSGAAGRQALAWLVADANDENTPIEIYDGDIEHYHIFVAKIASGIPDKITNE